MSEKQRQQSPLSDGSFYRALIGKITTSALPHYREDGFRTLFVEAALESGLHVVEPNRSTFHLKSPDAWDTLLVYRYRKRLFRTNDVNPDIRLRTSKTAERLIVGEFKVAMINTTSATNSSADAIYLDIIKLANGDCDFFCGLFDQEHISNARSTREDKFRGLFPLPSPPTDVLPILLDTPCIEQVDADWNGTLLVTSQCSLTCRSRRKLCLCMAQRAADIVIETGDAP